MTNNLGPYRTSTSKQIDYVGNRLYPARTNVQSTLSKENLHARYRSLSDDKQWGHAAQIHSSIFQAACKYFRELGALFIPLPLTTRMISSPGALYGRNAIKYTSDTSPVELRWFDHEPKVFLAESSQIYLELALLQMNVHNVFSIYNSFRKEQSDLTHLSEFHHIEYEGHVKAEQNVQIAESLLKAILLDLLTCAKESLDYFLKREQIRDLEILANSNRLFHRTSLKECLSALYADTKDVRYNEFTLNDTFGPWEQVRLTEIYDLPVAVAGLPLLEVPFYHAVVPDSDPPLAMATDLIWAGFVEIIGAGQRIASIEELKAKAKAFNLPGEDYSPYLRSREVASFKQSSGFGLGWERLVQALLCLPEIWQACPFPRTHLGITP